jgi:hypothetical protein
MDEWFALVARRVEPGLVSAADVPAIRDVAPQTAHR